MGSVKMYMFHLAKWLSPFWFIARNSAAHYLLFFGLQSSGLKAEECNGKEKSQETFEVI